MVTVISIIYKNLEDIEKTCESIAQQGVHSLEHIIIASKFSDHDRDTLVKRWACVNRKFIFDQDKSIYDAMNIGLRIAKKGWILFLNGGDTLHGDSAISMIYSKKNRSCLAFSTMQRYGGDVYIRPPCSFRNGFPVGFAHQGFVAPIDEDPEQRIFYNEHNPISADQEWMCENIKRYGVELYQEVLSDFRLGGISNRPSIRALELQFKSGNYRSCAKLLPKMLLYLVLRPRRFYNVLAKFKRYKTLS